MKIPSINGWWLGVPPFQDTSKWLSSQVVVAQSFWNRVLVRGSGRHRWNSNRTSPETSRLQWRSSDRRCTVGVGCGDALRPHHIGVSTVMGVPQNRWFIHSDWKLPLKWMMTGGTPIYGNPHEYGHLWFLGPPVIKLIEIRHLVQETTLVFSMKHCGKPIPMSNYQRLYMPSKMASQTLTDHRIFWGPNSAKRLGWSRSTVTDQDFVGHGRW